MKLYHGGNIGIPEPRIIIPDSKRTVDFGHGFYTTTNYEQAERWSRIRRQRNQNSGFVSIFEAPNNLLEIPALKVLRFNSADHAWLDFVMKNRNDLNFQHDYDLVAGPVANDRVYTTLSLFESELLDANETIHRLKTYVLTDQMLFHSEKALRHLTFLDTIEIFDTEG